ncbi:MAG: hypothetical protein M3Y55_00245, partial [Pseudomonadota bacterium]|nr:hypothetical protein [Pseudomonadota bacterium]
WLRGLKTTYYLRTLSATNAEKSTVKSSQHNAVGNGSRPSAAGTSAAPLAPVLSSADAEAEVKFCALDNPECEACQ